MLFKNRGPSAGSSLVHPHSQIVGLPEVPARFELWRMLATRHRQAVGRCRLCDVLDEEMRERARLVYENGRFLAFVPFAAFSMIHVWIVPRSCGPSFATASREDLTDLEDALTRVLAAIEVVGNQPDFNLVVLGGHPRDPEDAVVRGYISVVARSTKVAGFELGTGMHINPSWPEEKASELRAWASPGEAQA